ncbi:hypothetical protein ACFPK1_05850 [Actinomycetospora rhizophila]|uniref:Uncharacterized protein n=1 Tax=Actinomycetospora rhizophila TaxID=1416876 RepID=A0ABV9ZB25_9PSEU
MADQHATGGQSETSEEVPPRQDPWWPEVEGGHPITELMAPTQGSPSPFGETEFPLPADQLGYEHPVTEINR